MKPGRAQLDLSHVTPDTPLRLDVIASLAFPDGSMTKSGLRREITRGNLVCELIAGKHYTTLHAINEMRSKCRDKRKARASTSEDVTDENQSGSSSTERTRSALAAAQMIGAELRKPSPLTSARSTDPIGETVIQLR
jgi:hypothetical protein